jgi:hypothetical protein
MNVMKKCLLGLGLWLACISGANAVTDCVVTPSHVYAGDDGWFYVYYATPGGSSRIFHTDQDFKQVFALVTTAIVTDRDITVRYAGNGIACTAAGQDIYAVFLAH